MATLDDITECSICFGTFKNPKCLPCIHTFCLDCLKKYQNAAIPGSKMACPLCRQVFTVPAEGFDKLPNNFFIQQLIDVKLGQEQAYQAICPPVCDICSDDTSEHALQQAIATGYCVNCLQNLCKSCSTQHTKQTFAKSHKVVTLEEKRTAVQSNHIIYCEQHEDKALELYCHDCKMVICMMCFAVKHRGHKCADLKESSKELTVSLKEDQKKIEDIIGPTQGRSKLLAQTKDEFVKNVSDVMQKVESRAKELKDLVDAQKKQLLEELNKIKEKHIKETEERVLRMETNLLNLKTFKNYSEELVNKGSPCDISLSANDLLTRAQVLIDDTTPGIIGNVDSRIDGRSSKNCEKRYEKKYMRASEENAFYQGNLDTAYFEGCTLVKFQVNFQSNHLSGNLLGTLNLQKLSVTLEQDLQLKMVSCKDLKLRLHELRLQQQQIRRGKREDDYYRIESEIQQIQQQLNAM